MKRLFSIGIIVMQIFGMLIPSINTAPSDTPRPAEPITFSDIEEEPPEIALPEDEIARPAEVDYDIEGIDEFLRPDLIPVVEEIASQYQICPELIEAIIERESRGISDIYASEGSYGLMQVYKRWHIDRMARLGVTDLFDEYSNILVGTDYLNNLTEIYGDDLYLVLGKYNGQSDCAEGVPNEYAQVIIDRAAELEQLHDYHMSISVRENIVHSTGGIK